ncbi:MAG: DUF3106 domain-containing protein [Candidatus Thiodiazotropha sp.]
MREKWKDMSPDERQRLKQRILKRWKKMTPQQRQRLKEKWLNNGQ